MANPNQSVRACILKVDIKCCTGCQKKANKKLQSIPGVIAVDYNQEKGLMTVTGDVEPMALVKKLAKWNKKAELVSVKYQLDDDDYGDDDLKSDEEEEDTTASETSSNPDTKSKPQEERKKKSNKTKCFGLGCFWKKKSKAKNYHQPLRMQNWHVPSKFENAPSFGSGFGLPFANVTDPYQHMMMQPRVPMTGPAAMLQPPHYHVNKNLHYPGK